MNLDKIILIAIVGMVLVVVFDLYTKSSAAARKDELRSQELANEAMYQQSQLAQSGDDERGILGSIFSSVPILGGLW
jgi:type II secretory pathway pseudopilin PulG